MAVFQSPAFSEQAREEVKSTGPSDAEPAESPEPRLVQAVSHNVSIAVESGEVNPARVKINPGTTVVWVNSSTQPVTVRFLSEAVSTTCKAPRGFVVGPRGIYVSETLTVGAVASLCFLEPNEYDYEVIFDASADEPGKVASGQVVVGG